MPVSQRSNTSQRNPSAEPSTSRQERELNARFSTRGRRLPLFPSVIAKAIRFMALSDISDPEIATALGMDQRLVTGLLNGPESSTAGWIPPIARPTVLMVLRQVLEIDVDFTPLQLTKFLAVEGLVKTPEMVQNWLHGVYCSYKFNNVTQLEGQTRWLQTNHLEEVTSLETLNTANQEFNQIYYVSLKILTCSYQNFGLPGPKPPNFPPTPQSIKFLVFVVVSSNIVVYSKVAIYQEVDNIAFFFEDYINLVSHYEPSFFIFTKDFIRANILTNTLENLGHELKCLGDFQYNVHLGEAAQFHIPGILC